MRGTLQYTCIRIFRNKVVLKMKIFAMRMDSEDYLLVCYMYVQ